MQTNAAPAIEWTKQCDHCRRNAYPYCPAGHKVAWKYDSKVDLHTAQIGRYTVIVWTGSTDPNGDDGRQVMSAYIPTTDRELPDGKMIVGRRVMDTHNRDAAQLLAVELALAEIKQYEADRS